eukprot:TRINITY_DN17248_c0_g1_i1.p1 TRINITY_DN17248_c0_g1~~TRINITY_DN17248_c0_g1_i1.p1  ORF type:complete len:560 (+),score=122.06 TRINITY_DN17248_c0_g1_i1:227-1906(+)
MVGQNSEWELRPHPVIPRGKPFLLIVMDGWGENKEDDYNGIYKSDAEFIKGLKAHAPDRWRTIKAHGTAVGLPSDGDMGNSEVGHNAMGAGRIIEQGAKLVDSALHTEKIFEDEGFKFIKEAWDNGGTLHMIGLLSDGGVHSRYDQMIQVVHGAFDRGCKRVRLHILTDGRDVPDGSSIKFVGQLEKDLEQLRTAGCDALIASGGGRMNVTMDRYEADWKIVERGWHAHVLGEAPHKNQSALDAITELKAADPKTGQDQYLPPFVIVDAEGKPVGTIEDGDAVVCFNYRADRVIQISKAFEYENFTSFDRVRYPKVRYAGMMQYDGDLKLPAKYLVSPPLIDRTSGEYLVKNGVRTFACSETQKFGHVTFFWNGNRSGKLDDTLETYHEVTSDILPFNEAPLMKAAEITAAAKEALLSGKYDYVRINFANGDMVGHTGVLDAVLAACKAVDDGVKELVEAVTEAGGSYLITADHGNCDDMAQRNKKGDVLRDANGNVEPLTSHTLAPVPVAIGGPNLPANIKFRDDLPNAGLANVTATYINLLGFEAPAGYEPSLLTSA